MNLGIQKERLIEDLTRAHQTMDWSWGANLSKIIDELYDNNLIIPRGENRHPDADVIHAMAEGIKCDRNEPITGWQSCNFDESVRYRIKPSESIYEWQWLANGNVIDLGFFTDEECKGTCSLTSWVKIDATKRERK